MEHMSTSDTPYAFVSYASADRDRALGGRRRAGRGGRRRLAGPPQHRRGHLLVRRDRRGHPGLRRAPRPAVSPAAMASPNVAQEVQLGLGEPPPPPAAAAGRRRAARPPWRYALAGRQWVELLDRPAEDWRPDLLRALAGLGLAPGRVVPARARSGQCDAAPSPPRRATTCPGS